MKQVFSMIAGGVLLVCTGCQSTEPITNINYRIHPKLADAQHYAQRAVDTISGVQREGGDVGGHAERAKELLARANDELIQAATLASAKN